MTVVHLPSRDEKECHDAMEAYKLAVGQYHLSPSQENLIATQSAYAKWVRLYVGGDRAEMLIGKFHDRYFEAEDIVA